MGSANCCGSNAKSVKGKKLVMLGLDKSGKTTILYLVTKGQYVPAITTLGQNQEILSFEKNQYTLYDFGGSNIDLGKLKENLVNSRGIIFTIDGSDEKRLKQSQDLFRAILSEKNLKDLPILIFICKCDLECKVNEEMIKDQFKLLNFAHIEWLIQKCSAKKREGIEEGFRWLTNKVNQKKKSPSQTSNTLIN